jgi:hypothetical protein
VIGVVPATKIIVPRKLRKPKHKEDLQGEVGTV